MADVFVKKASQSQKQKIVKAESPTRTEIQESQTVENDVPPVQGSGTGETFNDTRWTPEMTTMLIEAAKEYAGGVIKWESIRAKYRQLSGFSGLRLRERHRNIVKKVDISKRRNLAYIYNQPR